MTSYEWVAEKLDEWGDVEEVFQFETRAEAEREGGEIALCRRVHNADDGDELDREYAYVIDGELPPKFDGGSSVPKRFLK